MEVLTVADRLNRLPVTRAHIRATVIVGLGLFFDLFDVFLAGVLSTVSISCKARSSPLPFAPEPPELHMDSAGFQAL